MLDDSASMLLLTDIWRGMSYTLGAFFDKKVTVGAAVELGDGQGGCTGAGKEGEGQPQRSPARPTAAVRARSECAWPVHMDIIRGRYGPPAGLQPAPAGKELVSLGVGQRCSPPAPPGQGLQPPHALLAGNAVSQSFC